MLLDASGGGSMNKIGAKFREFMYNVSLNEYRPQSENMGVVKKQGVRCLQTHDALLKSNKLLSDKIKVLLRGWKQKK